MANGEVRIERGSPAEMQADANRRNAEADSKARKYGMYSDMSGFLSKFFLNEYYTEQKMEQEEIKAARDWMYFKLRQDYAKDAAWDTFKKQNDYAHGKAGSGIYDENGFELTNSEVERSRGTGELQEGLRDGRYKSARDLEEESYGTRLGMQTDAAIRQAEAVGDVNLRKQLELLTNPDIRAARREDAAEQFKWDTMKTAFNILATGATGRGGKGRAGGRGGDGSVGLADFNSSTARQQGLESWAEMDSDDRELALAAAAKAGKSTEEAKQGYVNNFVNTAASNHANIAGAFAGPEGEFDMNSFMGAASQFYGLLQDKDSTFSDFTNMFTEEEEQPRGYDTGMQQGAEVPERADTSWRESGSLMSPEVQVREEEPFFQVKEGSFFDSLFSGAGDWSSKQSWANTDEQY